jgi:hypothetical protein
MAQILNRENLKKETLSLACIYFDVKLKEDKTLTKWQN